MLGVLAMVGAVNGVTAFIATRIRYRRRPDGFPSGKQHCCTWCCGFFYATLAFLFGGAMLFLGMITGETCMFIRQEIFTEQMANYGRALSLVPVQEDFAEGAGMPPPAMVEDVGALNVQLALTCFSPNGTGKLLNVMELDQLLAFEPDLTNAFFVLQSRVSEPPAGRDTGELLVELAEVASAFGGLFILDPLPVDSDAGPSNTLGVLELGSNVRDLLLGSSVEPEDRKGPDQLQTIYGLNSFAALIAGPGKYTFAHGTAGGGFVITPDRPTDAELQNVPNVVKNALLYGRAKETLLTSNSTVPCDELDDAGVVILRGCSVLEFQQFASTEVARIRQAVERASEEAGKVESLFLSDLSVELRPTLRNVRDLRTVFDCRFLWRRTEDLYGSLCEDLAPIVARGFLQLVALSTVTGLGVFVQYKVWRHLKDNKVVGIEMARFEAALERFEEDLHEMKSKAEAKEARMAAYRQAVIEGTAIEVAEAEE